MTYFYRFQKILLSLISYKLSGIDFEYITENNFEMVFFEQFLMVIDLSSDKS